MKKESNPNPPSICSSSKIKENLGLLGLKVKDKITGMEGIITSISFDLYGCIQAIISPDKLDKDGKIQQGSWFDTNRLNILSKKPVMEVPKFEYAPNGSADKPKKY